jgi:chemotaxis protein CheY-P-specific phosphatase CheC
MSETNTEILLLKIAELEKENSSLKEVSNSLVGSFKQFIENSMKIVIENKKLENDDINAIKSIISTHFPLLKSKSLKMKKKVKQLSISKAFYKIFIALKFYFWSNIMWFYIYITKK